MDKGLELRDLRIAYDGAEMMALNCKVGPGEILTVMGPSGVGKSTLLSAITGNLSPEFDLSGQIFLDGHDITHVPPHRRRVGILFQDDLLFPHLSVAENLGFGLRPGGSRAERRALIDAALADVGLEGMAERDPATLSGGQRARVALMRMLLAEPCALLLDEAFSRLDMALRDQVRSLVFARAKLRNLPVLMVTHDELDAVAAGGPVLTLG